MEIEIILDLYFPDPNVLARSGGEMIALNPLLANYPIDKIAEVIAHEIDHLVVERLISKENPRISLREVIKYQYMVDLAWLPDAEDYYARKYGRLLGKEKI